MSDSLISNAKSFHHSLAELRPKLSYAHDDLYSIIAHALEAIHPDDPLRKSFKKLKRSLAASTKQLALVITALAGEPPLPPGPN